MTLALSRRGARYSWWKVDFSCYVKYSNNLPIGIITTGFGLICLWIVPNDPLKSKFLTTEERKLAIARIQADQVGKRNADMEKTTWALVGRAVNFNVSR